MKLWLKLFLTYAVFLVAIMVVGIFGVRSAITVGDGFHRVNREVVPLLGHLKDLRFAGLRIVSSTMEYVFLRSSSTGAVSAQQEEEEEELVQQGRSAYLKSLSACRDAMSGSDVSKRDFREIELAGDSLLSLSARMASHAGMLATTARRLEIKEEFETAERRFLASVSNAHNRVIEDLHFLEKNAFESISTASTGIEIMLALCCTAAIGLAFLFSTRISRRIIVLKDSAELVASGDLDQRVLTVSGDEIGELSASFNNMVETLGEAQQRLADAHSHLEGIFSSVPDILLVVDRSGTISDCNRAVTDILGYEREAIRERSLASYCSDPVEAGNLLAELQSAGSIADREVELITSSGVSIPFTLSVSPLSAVNQANGFICIAHDVSSRKKTEERIRELAYKDSLTGLPNRVLFFDRCDQAIAVARRKGERMALLFFDLDHFKDINDTMGHHAGDLLLKAVAYRLHKILRSSDTFARLGGDEFAILCSSIAFPQDAAIVADKILHQLRQPIVIEGKEIYTSASIGIVTYPEDGAEKADLLKNADLAMYAAKDQGRKTFNFFSDELNLKAQERATIELGLRHALQSGQLVLHYQPQVEMGSGRLFGVEALCRWLHPELGFIAPDRFIPVAEQTGMIRTIGDWVLRTACRQCAEWHGKGYPVHVAVNVSIYQLQFAEFPEKVREALSEAGLAPEYLELEITESLLMKSAEESVEMIRHLKAIGVKIAIDDFGTGYSSLNYLNKFSLDRIKIDKSFVREITLRADAAVIVRAIVAIGHSLGYKVIAEGIESRDEEEMLLGFSCDEAQGFFYSRPMAADDVGALIFANKPLGR